MSSKTRIGGEKITVISTKFLKTPLNFSEKCKELLRYEHLVYEGVDSDAFTLVMLITTNVQQMYLAHF